jgi:hypothetical protein
MPYLLCFAFIVWLNLSRISRSSHSMELLNRVTSKSSVRGQWSGQFMRASEHNTGALVPAFKPRLRLSYGSPLSEFLHQFLAVFSEKRSRWCNDHYKQICDSNRVVLNCDHPDAKISIRGSVSPESINHSLILKQEAEKIISNRFSRYRQFRDRFLRNPSHSLGST